MKSRTSPASPATLRSTLQNGVEVALTIVPSAATGTLVVKVRAGCLYESAEHAGVSHFVEHLVMCGNALHGEPAALHRAAAMVGGELVAWTHRDSTDYRLDFLPEHVGDAVALIAATVSTPIIEPDRVEVERKVILHETVQYLLPADRPGREEDVARWLCYGDTARGRAVIGYRRTIDQLSVEDLRAHVGHHYAGSNLVVALAGPFDASALDVIARAFGTLASGERARFVESYSPFRRGLVQSPDSDRPAVHLFTELGWQPTDLEIELLVLTVDDGLRSPFHQEVADRQGLAYTTSCEINRDAEVTTVQVVARVEPQAATATLRAMVDVLRRLVNDPVDARELDATKARHAMLRAARSTSSTWWAAEVAEALINDRELPDPVGAAAVVESLTGDDVQRLLRRTWTEPFPALLAVGTEPVDVDKLVPRSTPWPAE